MSTRVHASEDPEAANNPFAVKPAEISRSKSDGVVHSKQRTNLVPPGSLVDHFAAPAPTPNRSNIWSPNLDDVANMKVTDAIEDGVLPFPYDEIAGVPNEADMLRSVEAALVGPYGHRVVGELHATTYMIRFVPTSSNSLQTSDASSSAHKSGVGGKTPTEVNAYRVRIPGIEHLSASYFCIPVALIKKLDRFRGSRDMPFPGVDIECKDVRSYRFIFANEDWIEQVLDRLNRVAFPKSLTSLHAFFACKAAAAHQSLPGWDLYSPFKEMKRQGVLDVKCPFRDTLQWKFVDKNRKYTFSPTYPAELVFPELFSDSMLDAVGSFRAKARVPALTYRHRPTGAVILRSSQPKVGMSNNSCREDETLLSAYRETVSNSVLAALAVERAAMMEIASNESSLEKSPGSPKKHIGDKGIGPLSPQQFSTWVSNCGVYLDNYGNPVVYNKSSKIFSTVTGNDKVRQTSPTSLGGAAQHAAHRRPMVVADCRPKANAMANRAAGWGYETYNDTHVVFLNIDNIHAVRGAFRKVEMSTLQTGMGPQTGPSKVSDASFDLKFGAAIEQTLWLSLNRSILGGAFQVADTVHRARQSVLVHCSDGWDRTPQVCCLAQMLLDPYCRTIEGLCTLIGKDWCSFGHRFQTRSGQGSKAAAEDKNCSPIFLQFLDCIWQLVIQFPRYFEFTPTLLLALAHHSLSCRFGSLLYDCDNQRNSSETARRTPSLWHWIMSQASKDMNNINRIRHRYQSYVDAPISAPTSAWLLRAPLHVAQQCLNATSFVSPIYDPTTAQEVMTPPPSLVLRRVRLWTDFFCRWSPVPSITPSNSAGFDASVLMEALQPCNVDSSRLMSEIFHGHSTCTGTVAYESIEAGFGLDVELPISIRNLAVEPIPDSPRHRRQAVSTAEAESGTNNNDQSTEDILAAVDSCVSKCATTPKTKQERASVDPLAGIAVFHSKQTDGTNADETKSRTESKHPSNDTEETQVSDQDLKETSSNSKKVPKPQRNESNCETSIESDLYPSVDENSDQKSPSNNAETKNDTNDTTRVDETSSASENTETVEAEDDNNDTTRVDDTLSSTEDAETVEAEDDNNDTTRVDEAAAAASEITESVNKEDDDNTSGDAISSASDKHDLNNLHVESGPDEEEEDEDIIDEEDKLSSNSDDEARTCTPDEVL